MAKVVPILVVGLKSDLEENRTVGFEEFCEYEIYIETSSLNKNNVEEVFVELVRRKRKLSKPCYSFNLGCEFENCSCKQFDVKQFFFKFFLFFFFWY